MTSFANRLEVSSIAAPAVGPKAAMPAARQPVDKPQGEWSFGPDKDRVNALAPRERDERLDVGGGDRNAAAVCCDSRIPRSGDQLERRVVTPKPPGERMLTPTAAHEEDARHAPVLPLNASANASRARLIASATVFTASRAVSE